MSGGFRGIKVILFECHSGTNGEHTVARMCLSKTQLCLRTITCLHGSRAARDTDVTRSHQQSCKRTCSSPRSLSTPLINSTLSGDPEVTSYSIRYVAVRKSGFLCAPTAMALRTESELAGLRRKPVTLRLHESLQSVNAGFEGRTVNQLACLIKNTGDKT